MIHQHLPATPLIRSHQAIGNRIRIGTRRLVCAAVQAVFDAAGGYGWRGGGHDTYGRLARRHVRELAKQRAIDVVRHAIVRVLVPARMPQAVDRSRGPGGCGRCRAGAAVARSIR